MKIFVGEESAWSEKSASLAPLLAFHWDGVSIEARRSGAKNPESPFTVVIEPADAAVHVLPREWNSYIWNQQLDAARDYGRLAERHGKNLLVWHSGDLPPIYGIRNIISFQPALYRSRLKGYQHAAPSLIADPLAPEGSATLTVRDTASAPVVGFCGYAEAVPLKTVYGVFSAARHNLLSRMGRKSYEPMPLLPATLLRARALDVLAADRRIETRFVVNKRAFKKQDKRAATEEAALQMQRFHKNIRDSDYTLCLRGFGNWSHRFYETLAHGRIPVFIDTDCVLPGLGDIDWKQYVVWVDEKEVARTADRLFDFHVRLKPGELAARQRACRELWETRLSRAGFMRHLPRELGVLDP